MRRLILDTRPLLALLVSASVGTWGVLTHPWPPDNVFLEIVALRDPWVFRLFGYAYATCWFTTSFLVVSVLLSVIAIVASRRLPLPHGHALPPYPTSDSRPEPMLVLGEARHATDAGRAARPTWLTIPQRGLYTGVMILGSVGTGKTSACMYPYVDQLLRWRAMDPEWNLGGPVLEVKGYFCHQVKRMLEHAGRAADYLEIVLDSGHCYKPLHNDLDHYAVASAVATLLNNLFGNSKEPFWPQGFTDLAHLVIPPLRISDG